MLKAQTVLCWEARDPRFLLETSLPWGLWAHVKSHSHLLLPQPAAEQKASAVRFHEEQCPLLPFTEGPGSSWTILGETSHLPISPLLMVFSPCLEESLVVFVRLVEDKMGVWYGCGRKRTPLEILLFYFSLNAFRFCVVFSKYCFCFCLFIHLSFCSHVSRLKFSFLLKTLPAVCSIQSAVQRRRWHPTPVLLPGKSHGRRSLVGYSPWGHKESDTTEWLHFFFTVVWQWKLSLGSLLFFGLLHHAVQWERQCYMSHILKSKKKHALVYLGCYNKILQTGWLINNKFISHSSRGWEA